MHVLTLAQLVGDNVRRRRRALRLTIESLAERTGTHSTTLGRIERGVGEPELSTLVKIADVLGCTAADLIAGVTARNLQK